MIRHEEEQHHSVLANEASGYAHSKLSFRHQIRSLQIRVFQLVYASLSCSRHRRSKHENQQRRSAENIDGFMRPVISSYVPSIGDTPQTYPYADGDPEPPDPPSLATLSLAHNPKNTTVSVAAR